MEYQEFLEYIKQHMVEALLKYQSITGEETADEAEEYEVLLQKIAKNNGIVLDAVTLYKKGQKISPNIYLNAYYEQYQIGRPIEGILRQLIADYTERLQEAGTLQVDNVYDFDAIRTKIVLRLVNQERNRLELAKCPHIPFLDFAITFRYLASKDAMGVASSIISNQEFEAWGVSIEELYEIALCNSMQHFPWRMESLAKVITKSIPDDLARQLPPEVYRAMTETVDQLCGVNMYVLTNDVGINGATSILYDKVLENFARVQDSNVFLLPASVHEMILIPEDEETDPRLLSQLVWNANQSSVGLIDLLSNQIYYYDRNTKDITIYELEE